MSVALPTHFVVEIDVAWRVDEIELVVLVAILQKVGCCLLEHPKGTGGEEWKGQSADWGAVVGKHIQCKRRHHIIIKYPYNQGLSYNNQGYHIYNK